MVPTKFEMTFKEIALKNEPWAFYHQYANDYGDWKYPPAVREFQRAEKNFLMDHVRSGSKLIDIGCGPGEHIASILDKHCEITAVDFVQEMIDVAKQKVGREVEFLCEDIMNLSFPEDYFDYGICYCTLPNQIDYEKVFDRISYFCKNLIISVYAWHARVAVKDFYSLNGLHPRLNEKEKLIQLDEGMRYVFISEEVVKKMYRKNGYDLNIFEQDFGSIYFGVKKM